MKTTLLIAVLLLAGCKASQPVAVQPNPSPKVEAHKCADNADCAYRVECGSTKAGSTEGECVATPIAKSRVGYSEGLQGGYIVPPKAKKENREKMDFTYSGASMNNGDDHVEVEIRNLAKQTAVNIEALNLVRKISSMQSELILDDVDMMEKLRALNNPEVEEIMAPHIAKTKKLAESILEIEKRNEPKLQPQP